MRLLDQVGQAAAPVLIEDGRGHWVMPGCAERAAAVRDCPLRYVLDADAAAACAALRPRHGLVLPRLPAGDFWLEWADADGRRTGMLVTGVEGDGGGGKIETFWEQSAGEPDRAQLTLHVGGAGSGQGVRFAIPADAHPLASHLVAEMGRGWAEHFFHAGDVAGLRAVATVAGDVLAAADMLFAFALLLQARGSLATTLVDRSRLNRARAGLGKAALLDHVEVRLTLGREATADAGSGEARRAARLHQVRGHVVLRAGRLFWRRAHARGHAAPVTTRTVQVGLA